jgi:hypothetical protein
MRVWQVRQLTVRYEGSHSNRRTMTKLLILIVVVLGILAVAQLARVYELTSRCAASARRTSPPADNR